MHSIIELKVQTWVIQNKCPC